MDSSKASILTNSSWGGGFAQNAFRLFKRDILTFVALTATSIIIARVLGPTKMGAWAILLMLPSYAAAFGRLQVDTASVFFIGSGRYRLGDISFALLIIAAFMSLVLGGLFFWQQDRLFASLLNVFVDQKHLVYLTVAIVPLSFLAMNYMYLLQARQDFQGFNVQVLLRTLAAPISGATGLLIVAPSLDVLVWTVIGGTVLSVVYGMHRVHRAEMMRVHANLRLIRDLMGFGLKMYVGSVIGYFSTYLAGLMVLAYLTTEEVAYFQIALARALLLAKVASASGTILYPRVSEMGEQASDSRDLSVRAIRITLLVSLAAGAVGLIAAYPLVVLLYGIAYVDVALPLMILIPAVTLQSSTGLMTNFFLGVGRVWTTVGFSVVALVPQVALLWIVVPRWGVPGAAAATAGAWVLASLVRLVVFSVVAKAPVRDLVFIRKDDLRFVYGFGMKRVKALVRAMPGV